MHKRSSHSDFEVKKSSYSSLISNQKKYEDLSHFLNHDLREPARTIKVFSELLQKKLDKKIDSETKECLNFISAKAEVLNKMILAMAEYLKLNSYKPLGVLIRSETLGEWAKHVYQSINPGISQRPLNVVCLIDSIIADKNLMKKAIGYLIENSKKHNKNNPDLETTILFYQDKENYKIAIYDNGIGIKPKYSSQALSLFQSFTSEGQKSNEAGMGLSLANQVCISHNGQLFIDNSYTQGLKVIISIPKNPTEEV